MVEKVGQHNSRKSQVIEKSFFHVTEGGYPKKFRERMQDDLLREDFKVALHETDVEFQ